MTRKPSKGKRATTLLVENGFWREIATQGHSKSLILQSITGRQWVAYRHVILLVLSLMFPKKYSHPNRQKLPSSTTPLSFDSGVTPTVIRIRLIFPETRVTGLHLSLIGLVFEFQDFQECELEQNSAKIWTYSSSSSSRVIDFGTNRKRIYDFLLVINSNLCSILHRFWDTATYWLQIAYFSNPSLIRRLRSLCSLWNFAVKLTTRKLESRGY